MVGAGGACVLGSADVVVVALVAVGSTGGADGLLASDWARALPAANVNTAAMTSAGATKAPGFRRHLRPMKANSAIELHAAHPPGGCWAPAVPQPNRFFESLYWPSAAWHQPLSKAQPGERSEEHTSELQ